MLTELASALGGLGSRLWAGKLTDGSSFCTWWGVTCASGTSPARVSQLCVSPPRVCMWVPAHGAFVVVVAAAR